MERELGGLREADRREGFDLGRGSQMRLTVVKDLSVRSAETFALGSSVRSRWTVRVMVSSVESEESAADWVAGILWKVAVSPWTVRVRPTAFFGMRLVKVM